MTTPVTLPSLATPDDVVARLGRNLNQLETARIDALLADGSAIIRRYCRRTFTQLVNDVRILRSDGGVVKLPGRPVTSVTSVVAVVDAPGIPNLNVTWYVFDGIDELRVPDPSASGVINLPDIWYDIGWFTNTFQVTYTHGDNDIPDEVTSVLCAAVISLLTAPTQAGGVVSESVGAYSYRLQRTGGVGIQQALVDVGMREALQDFRTRQGTIGMKF